MMINGKQIILIINLLVSLMTLRNTCSLSNKCLFIFVNVALSAFQLENQAHLSFVNCKVLNYIQGLICRPKHLLCA